MWVAKGAEEVVEKYFKENRGFNLIKPNRGERGFDFRDKNSTIFIEVKGSSTARLSDIMFLTFTNSEYEKAKDCLRGVRRMKFISSPVWAQNRPSTT